MEEAFLLALPSDLSHSLLLLLFLFHIPEEAFLLALLADLSQSLPLLLVETPPLRVPDHRVDPKHPPIPQEVSLQLPVRVAVLPLQPEVAREASLARVESVKRVIIQEEESKAMALVLHTEVTLHTLQSPVALERVDLPVVLHGFVE